MITQTMIDSRRVKDDAVLNVLPRSRHGALTVLEIIQLTGLRHGTVLASMRRMLETHEVARDFCDERFGKYIYWRGTQLL